MKKISLVFLQLILLVGLYGQSFSDRPVAVIKLHKTEALPQTKFRRYEKTMTLQKGGEDLTLEEKKQLLDVIINQMLVKQDAETKGISVSEEEVLPAAMQTLSRDLQQMNRIPAGAVLQDPEQFKKLLVDNGQDYDLYLENTRNSLLVERYIAQTRRSDFENMEGPGDKLIQDFYNQNIAQFAQPEYVLLSQVFFQLNGGGDKAAVKQKADDLYRKISSGSVSFEDAVKNEGDNFPYTQVKGQPFTIARADAQAIQIFGADFTNGLFEGKDQSIVYLMESNIGYHIFRINDHMEARVLGLDNRINPLQEMTVRDYLTQILYSQMQQKLYAELQKEVVADLRDRAEVTTFEDAL